MDWNNANESDKILKEAFVMLYGENKKILHLLLDAKRPQLASPIEIIKQDMAGLSTGEQLLVQIGLDVWSGQGGIHFNELYQTLDDKNFQKILLVLLYLRSKQ